MNWTDVKDKKGFVLYGGGKLQITHLSMDDAVCFSFLQKAQALAKAARFKSLSIPNMTCYSCILHPFQILDLKLSDPIGWLRAHESLKDLERQYELLFPQVAGKFENLILFEDESLPLFETGGLSGDLPYAIGYLINQNETAEATHIKLITSVFASDITYTDKKLLQLSGQQIG